MIRTVIIGGGAVAEALAHEIEVASKASAAGSAASKIRMDASKASGGVELAGQWTRKTHTPAELAPADLYIVAVSDEGIADVTDRLHFPEDSVVAHTAGGVSMDELSPRIAHRAVIYPLQTFSRGRRVDDFRRVPFFIEGSTDKALETAKALSRALSDNVAEISSPERARLHLAAVFASNFPNAMLSIAEELAAETGVPFDLLKPLVAETASKALEMPSPRLAQTGPAKRGDRTTQNRHTAILEAAGHRDLAELYRKISEEIWRISKKN